MGGAAALLRRRARLVAGAAVLAGLAGYYALYDRLPELPLWADVVVVSGVLIPASFTLVWLALPLRTWRGGLAVGLALALLAAVWHLADLDVAANFAKLAGAAAIAFWFLSYFERLSWVVIVAAVIPLVDAGSVWRGPTRHIVTKEPEVFGALSYAVPVPGERALTVRWEQPRAGRPSRYHVYRGEGDAPAEARVNRRPIPAATTTFVDRGEETDTTYRYAVEAVTPDGRRSRSATVTAPAGGEARPPRGRSADARAPRIVSVSSVPSTLNLGLPDVLFLSLFLGAAARWRLRVAWTWVAMLVSFAATMALAIWVDPFGIGGLPALPGLSIAFLAANADLLWRKRRL